MDFAMQATTEWKWGHIWYILATVQSHSFGSWDECPPPPCFRILFGKVHQCSILHVKTTGDLKSHNLQAGATALSVPPHHFLSAGHVFKGTHGLFGGGGECAPQPPLPLCPALFYKLITHAASIFFYQLKQAEFTRPN